MPAKRDKPTHRPCRRFDWERLLERTEAPVAQKTVGFMMAMRADPDGSNVKVTALRIANATNWSETHVENSINALRALGLLECRLVGVPGHPSVYQLTDPGESLPMRLSPDGARLIERPKGRGGKPTHRARVEVPDPEDPNSSSGVEGEDPNSSSGDVTEDPNSSLGLTPEDPNPSSGVEGEDPNSSSGLPSPSEITPELQLRKTPTGVAEDPNSSWDNHVLPTHTKPMSGYYLTPTSAGSEPDANNETGGVPDLATAYRRARVTVDAAEKADRDRAFAQAAADLNGRGIVKTREITVAAARILEDWATYQLAEDDA